MNLTVAITEQLGGVQSAYGPVLHYYGDYLKACGLHIRIAKTEDVISGKFSFSAVDGLVLAGGNDICPSFFSAYQQIVTSTPQAAQKLAVHVLDSAMSTTAPTPLKTPLKTPPHTFETNATSHTSPAHSLEDASHMRKETETPVINRDVSEALLLNHALRTQLPVFGICRGLHMMNVCLGGTLYHDITEKSKIHHWQASDFEQPSHDVEILANKHPSPLEEAFLQMNHQASGTTASLNNKLHTAHPASDIHPSSHNSQQHTRNNTVTLSVNSVHHQAIHKVAPTLHTAAVAQDGLIEALYNPTVPFFLGVQWHPEMLFTHDEYSIFLGKAFANAVQRYHMQQHL